MNKVNVIKIGGSLLTTTSHLPRLQAYLEQFTEHSNLLICGGGRKLNALATPTPIQSRDKEYHYNSIQVMDRNTRLICEKLGVTCHGNEQEQFIDMNRWASLVQPGTTQGLEVLPFSISMNLDQVYPDCQSPVRHCDSIAASFYYIQGGFTPT